MSSLQEKRRESSLSDNDEPFSLSSTHDRTLGDVAAGTHNPQKCIAADVHMHDSGA
eukprot:CAMPEP_0197489272 /NCGR_PEP_ID=MMETSP1311-20131121/4099_1 /TAXON_ID=464262 /ORGANISM="Genus nov. species nov., Strain RCC856" /LENGTH=55 /DNA_ID=CAMNT_0043033545 /DNA_START=116 /DNA_END=280 /DNA_ORIENTATION=+